MIIALDFDGTYDVDPELWGLFIDAAKTRGHSITFVTFRDDFGTKYDNADICEAAQRHSIDIVYCNAKQKSECFKADVWIDDMPLLIPSMDAMLTTSILRG